MIIIADAHVAESIGNHKAFFRMLDHLAKSDQAIVFLGDIFELWIAFDRYEESLHRRFMAWCAAQKQRRSIGYVEGNHEFFLVDRRDKYFSWVASGAGRPEGSATLFVHGDLINRRDRSYLLFRKITKNAAARHLVGVLPFGPSFVHYLSRRLKPINPQFRNHLPADEIHAFADRVFRGGIDTIFIGHFHRKYEYRTSQGNVLRSLPAWMGSGEVTLFDESSKRIRHLRWQDVPV